MQPNLLREPIRLAGLPLLRLQSDERLLRLAREGHAPAFSAVVDRYRPGLLRYCTRLVGEQRAEDAVQQTFVNAHRAMTERDVAIDLKPWLYRIAHNAALNLLRGESAGFSLDDPAAAGATEALTSPGADVEAVVVGRERIQDTMSAIAALPAHQRDALVLRELEGRSHEEIAGALGVTPGAARQHLMRARTAMRAAVTAITPYPLVIRAAHWASLNPVGEGVAQTTAGVGLGAGVLKLTAGVLVTGAVVGGAVGGLGHPATPARPHPAAPAHTASAAASSGATVPARAATLAVVPAPRPHAARRHRSARRAAWTPSVRVVARPRATTDGEHASGGTGHDRSGGGDTAHRPTSTTGHETTRTGSEDPTTTTSSREDGGGDTTTTATAPSEPTSTSDAGTGPDTPTDTGSTTSSDGLTVAEPSSGD